MGLVKFFGCEPKVQFTGRDDFQSVVIQGSGKLTDGTYC
jgi:hypothetical protein